MGMAPRHLPLLLAPLLPLLLLLNALCRPPLPSPFILQVHGCPFLCFFPCCCPLLCCCPCCCC